MTKTRLPLRLILCVLSLFVPGIVAAQQTQQLVFTGLRSVASQGQFNAVQTAPNGNLYLLLDQKDGVRVLKTDANANTILAQAQLGAKGDIGLAMALDPNGNVYVTGTTASGSLAATSGVAFPNSADTSTNSFIAKFDSDLNPLFVTFTGSGRTAAAAIAATSDAVFITGSIFGVTLPVTANAFTQTPSSNTTQNGFAEKFNASGTTLLYATYLSGANGNTAPAAIAADSSDNAYIAGYTTSSGYPTLAALIPEMIGASSGFLTKLTPTGDGIVFSTYIPGSGITSLVLDSTAQNLLLSGTIALGQFPVASVAMPLVNLPYQTLLRIPLDGSAVLSSTLLAPGTQSIVTPAPNGEAWATGALTTPLLPLPTLSTIGNAFALRITAQNNIDEILRFGGLPTTNPGFASAPVTLTSLTTDSAGQPIFAGAVTPTASSSLLATQTYDLPLYNSPTAALPSTVRNAVLAPGTCNGSLCAGSAAYLTKVDPATAAPSLVFSTDDSPNITLRNLGSAGATGLQLNATGFTLSTDCPSVLAPGSECSIALSGSGPGTITAQADNAATQTVALPAVTTTPNAIVFSPKGLDFGIETASSPSATRTVTVTNLSTQSQTFASSTASAQFTQQSSDCAANGTAKLLPAGATCHITIAFTAVGDSASDGPIQSNWTVGPGSVLLTGYTEAAALSVSASEIDFGTQYTGGFRLPRYLYLSNNSAATILHTAVSLSSTSPFTLIDRCPTQLLPHTVCQLQLNYLSAQSPSNDSITLSLDQSLTVVLVTGKTLPPPGAGGATVNPNLTVSPSSLNFPNAVPVTAVSSATQTVTVGNTGTQSIPLALSLSGDFTQATGCTSTLAAHSTCTVVIAFAPSQPGTRQGLLSVTAGAATTPAYIALSGTATPILSTNNGTLDFGNVIADQPAVQWYKITQSFTRLSAATSGSAFKAILVEDIGYGHGTPPTSAFSTNASGSCTNCWLGLQFIPPVTGPQVATVELRSSAPGNAYTLGLTGNGLPLTGLILSPTSDDFGAIPINSTSAPTLFSLTNLTSSAVTLTTPTASAGFGISSTPTGGASCTGILAPSASCFVEVTFAPTAAGQIAGTLTLPTTANSLTASLSGFGAPDPGLSLTPNALTFNNVPGATATQQVITLKNTGAATLQIATPTVTTSNFTLTTTCAALTPGAICTIAITYNPGSAPATDTLTIPVNSSLTGAATYTVPLAGAYTTEDSGLQIIPAETDFGPQLTSNLGLTRQFTINNLTAKSLTLALSLPRQFVLADPPCAALAPNASCNFSVAFLPLTNGNITGTIFAQATPTDGTATLDSLGYVEGYGLGTGTLSITGNLIPTGGEGSLLNFGQVASGQSLSQTLTLTNPNTTAVTIHRVTSEWPFLSTTNCGTALAPSQSCTVTVNYSPLNQAATGTTSPLSNTDTGSLVIESDALTSPDVVDLIGTAAPILVSVPDNTAPLAAYTASQNSLTFASTAVGDVSSSQNVTLSNTGTLTLHITGLQSSPDFTSTSTCATLVPGASCTLTVTFTPQLSGTRVSALEISSDASTALDFISLLGNATPASLSFSPVSLNFGNLLVGSSSTLPVQITNTSATPAVFHGITATGDYTVAGDCPAAGSSLAANTSCVLEATFTPTQTGERAGAIEVSSSLSTLPLTVAMTGTGTQSHLQSNPASLDFGSLSLAAPAELTLTLSNSGNAPVTGLHFAVTGDYAVITPCALTTLASGASCSVTISFTPTALGTRAGSFAATSTSNPPLTVPLTGTGVPNGSFLLTVNGESSSSATVKSGYPAAYTLTVTPQNSFSGTIILNCSPITPGQYATCALLPSSIALSGAAQNATATLNTITSQATLAQANHQDASASGMGVLFCLLPAAVLFFWRTRSTHIKLCVFVIAATAMLTLNGCGSGGALDSTDPNLRKTPPGTYRYQITATSATGPRITQTVTLNLTVQ